ncbi:cupin domain-containing protein [Streptomyces sp. NBC_00237]|uniref:JmjC domain-containing protein n=1 Tax=Streptomyces sp. NBC_00237 TaxID=2975687 RepID=UPI002255AC4F|nr:cupin domain-containing protein [Streptomyces sp. NBC_00237]MCX5202990.1 cupin domain-containing protein [Streptomyces sp. NBC_00237]
MNPMATDWLARLVHDESAFFADHWRQAPVVLRPHDPPVGVLTVADLDGVLDAGLLTAPYAQLVHEHGTVPAERFCAPRVVLGEIADGYVDAEAVRRIVQEERVTLLFRYVDQWHAGVRALTDTLAERFARQVEAFCFLTPPGTTGRPVHRDDADVLAVQLHGAKRWQVYGGPVDGNWQPEREQGNPGPLLLDAVLRPGEVLYVPRGYAHRASAVRADSVRAVGEDFPDGESSGGESSGEESSVHLSLTVREAGTAQLYALSSALLLAESGDLPARPTGDAALTDTAADLIAAFRRTLDDLTPAELVDLARGAMRAQRTEPAPVRTLGALVRGV